MRLAVIGTGISGLVAAHRLYRNHDLTVFEAEDRIGGHTHTVDVAESGRSLSIDTGFIVFNEPNYPGFTRLLRSLNVRHQPSDMSFSVRDERSGLEYRGGTLNQVFAQRRNLFRPEFHRMVMDILRFYREAPGEIVGAGEKEPLGRFLERGGYSRLFVESHIVPMACALWSGGRRRVEEMPMGFLVRFFSNHGMMQLRNRPQWRVVSGGSREYVRALTRPFRDRIRTGVPIEGIRRRAGVELKPRGSDWQAFDKVIVATHSDQALRLLTDADAREREVLGAIKYQRNDVVLHTDTRMLPRNRRAWSSWNYHVTREGTEMSTVTYLMNRLQGLAARRQYMVTLNRTGEIDPASILRRFDYHHPVFDLNAVDAQSRYEEINGPRDVFFCGAYWGFGFHEDGVQSAERVAGAISRLSRAA